ncbi:MAG: AbiV family abortive infection protein [Candidatus Hodarchaeales archaeon]|jgi:AbiV family abortive infection protein
MKWYEDEKRAQQIARTLCRSTHENVNQLLSDAELLIEKKSFGHGYALAVLAFEEWSKWWMVVGMYMGLLHHDANFARNMKNHIEKQFYAI